MDQISSMVTGACGFVGKHLVDALVARGDSVTAVDIGATPPRDDVRYLQADVCDPDAMREACKGQDVVFHNASLVHTRNNQQEKVWAVNEGGTRNVIAACRAEEVAKLVYVSSASTVYEGRDIEDGDESMGYASVSQAPYADSKIAAEKLVLAANGDTLATCALRPHVVFGPGDGRFLPAILKRAKAGKLKFSVGRQRKLSDFTYVSNLIDALLAADARLSDAGSPVAGQAYFITNGEPMPFFDFVDACLAKLALPPIIGAVPFWLAYGVAATAEAIDTLRGGTLNSEDGLSRFSVRYMCTHHYFSIAKAGRDLDYCPQVKIAQGIELTCQHLRAQEAAPVATQ